MKDLVRPYSNIHDIAHIAELVSNDIIGALQAFHTTMIQHSKKHIVVDTIAVSIIPHDPMMYWHTDDGDHPNPIYINYKSAVDRTNLKIEAFNLQYGSSNSPMFLHPAGKSGQNWREDTKKDKFHLENHHRIKMVKMICKYFDTATPKTLQHLL